MTRSKEAARRRLLALVLMSPLIIGIGVQWQGQLWPFLYHRLPFEKVPIPDRLGLFGVNEGALVPLISGEPMRVYDSTVEFVCRQEWIPSDRVWTIQHLDHRSSRNPPETSEAPWRQWIMDLEDFPQLLSETQKIQSLKPIAEISCEARAIPGYPKVARITPSTPLGPGVYALEEKLSSFHGRFVVDLESLKKEVHEILRKSIDQKQWEVAFQDALIAAPFLASDPQFKTEIEEIKYQLAVHAARQAHEGGDRQISEKALLMAGFMRRNAPELGELQLELRKQKEAEIEANRRATVEAAQEHRETLVAARVGSKVTPVDEGDQDPSFAAFRTGLVQTIEKKDAPALLAVVAKDVAKSEGGGDGMGNFVDFWQPDKAHSEIWWQLAGVLKHGGRFNEDRSVFTAPFVYTDFRESAKLHQEIGVVVGTDVSVRTEPRSKAPPRARLTFEVVKLQFGESPWFDDADGAEYPWYYVQLPNSIEGFVSGRYLRSPLDYHAVFTKRGSEWLLTELAHEWPRSKH